MSSNDSGQSEDRELLDRYRRASDTESSAPSDAVRTAILAEGRRVAAELKNKDSQRLFDTTRPAANDSRWKYTAFGTLGAALLAALIIAPRYWESVPASKVSTPVAARESAAGTPAAGAPAAAPAENSVNEPAVLADAERQAAAPVPKVASAPAPKLESVSPSASRDSLQEVPVTAARSRREEAPALPAAAATQSPESVPADARVFAKVAPPTPLAAPRAYVPQSEEKALAGASAHTSATSAADNATSRATNRIVAGALQGAPSPARLKAAAEAGDVAQTDALIDKGTDVNARDGQGRTALIIATSRGRLEVVRLLLQRGADVNLADNAGRTALRVALDQNLNDIAALLRDAGAR